MTANNLKLAFAAHDEQLLDVRHFSIHESMNELFEVSILAISKDDDIDLDSIVGKGAAFKLVTGNYKASTPVRVWAGVCAHMSQVHAEPAPGVSAYHIMIAPNFWRTTLRRNNRIFQHKKTQEILDIVFAEWQIKPVWKLQGDYKKHEYCVQYGETDFAFISRLLEDAGMAYYFTHDATSGKGDDIVKLNINDAPHLNTPRGGKLTYAGHQTPRFGGDEDFRSTVTLTQRVKPGKFTLRDFDFRLLPDKPLSAKAESKTREDVYEQYDYVPGVFWWEPGEGATDPVADDKGKARTIIKEGEATIKKQGEAERRRRLLVSFHTNALDLGPGVIVGINQESQIANHPRADLAPDKKLLLVETSIEGAQEGEWSMTASAVYSEFVYRPERRTPKPRIYGVQNAVVVGDPGEEIYTDEFGRVRVQFPWDREGMYDSNSSCWMRVSQAWAGGSFGMMNIPRVGHEVLVEFYDGDPDRPVIVGRVHNQTTGVPYKLPDNKTKSGWKSNTYPKGPGFNELSFEDKLGEERIHFQAEKYLSYIVKDSESSDVGSLRAATIGAIDTLDVGTTRAVKVGHYDSLDVGDAHTLSVGPTTGMQVFKEKIIVLSTGDASIKLAGPNIDINAKGRICIHSNEKIHISSSGGDIEIQGGKNVIINDKEKGEPVNKVDVVQPAKPPKGPTPGLPGTPPFLPSPIKVTVDKPGGIEDVNVPKPPTE